MSLRKPVLNEDVLDYDTQQTDYVNDLDERVKDGFDNANEDVKKLSLSNFGTYYESPVDLNTLIGGDSGLVLTASPNFPTDYGYSGFGYVETKTEYAGATDDLIQIMYPFRHNGQMVYRTANSSGVWDSWQPMSGETTTTITTFENGWGGILFLSRYGDLVSIKGNLSTTGTTSSGTLVATIPVDFRPTYIAPIAVAKLNTEPYDSAFLFWLHTNGNLEVRTTDTIPANQSSAELLINQVYSV